MVAQEEESDTLQSTAPTETGKRIVRISDTANETNASRRGAYKCHMPLRSSEGSSPAYSGPLQIAAERVIPVIQCELGFRHLLLPTSELPQHGCAAFGVKEQDVHQTIYSLFHSFILGTSQGG